MAVELHVLGDLKAELIGFVADRNEELRFVQDGAIEVGEHEVLVQHVSHGVGVVSDLDLIPEIFESYNFGFVAFGLGEG